MNGARRWLLGTCAAWALWASCLVWLYAVLSLGCEWAWQTAPGTGRLTAALAALWAVHLAALAGLLAWQLRAWPRHGLLGTLSRSLTLAALAATLWTGWAVLDLPPCAGGAPADGPLQEMR